MLSSMGIKERVMPMGVAMDRELAFRSKQIERGQSLQSTTELGFSHRNSPDSPEEMVDSLLSDRRLSRKRLREATTKLVVSQTQGGVVPVEEEMQREEERVSVESPPQMPPLQGSRKAGQSSASSPKMCSMAPKSKKGNRPAASTSTFDAERFQNAEDADRFISDFKDRTVIFERLVVTNDLVQTPFLNWLHVNRLMVLMNLNNECFEDWVREFYCNMTEVTASKFKSYVRGKIVTVTADLIALLLSLRRPAHPSYPFPNPDVVELQRNDVAAVLCRDPTKWHSSLLKIAGLKTDYRLLNTFVCNNLEPRGHSSDLQFPQAALLYYLGTGASVDVAQTIFNSMLHIYDKTRKLSLPFGAMICKLLIQAGCEVYSHEVPFTKRQKIDSRTRSMSESHVHNRIQGEPSCNEAIDEDDDNSLEHRLLAVEHAVYDQSLQIEHLEDQMNAGFADLKTYLTDMFSNLRQQ